ncbi:MAG: hypothetical protein ASARMPREDX12_004134 [Alectoria sarmentosa]|nr:MAG: hypothetical protein ASARMPREDX12_004134 [Alectoria sarmentosa]
MTDFQRADFQPYEQNLWQKPTIKSQGLWQEPSHKFGSIPEPLYRLCLSALNDNRGCDDCPARIYIYPTLETLARAINKIHDSFGGAFPKCKIQYGDPLGTAGESPDEVVLASVDDSRTRSVTLLFDPQSADESWTDFVARLEGLEKRWTVETESE